MVQKTSWKGIQTKRLRRLGKLRGGYTRYHNRYNRSGLEVVKNRKYYNDVFTQDGRFIGREFKYQNLATNDKVAKRIFNESIRKNIPVRIRRDVIR